MDVTVRRSYIAQYPQLRCNLLLLSKIIIKRQRNSSGHKSRIQMCKGKAFNWLDSVAKFDIMRSIIVSVVELFMLV